MTMQGRIALQPTLDKWMAQQWSAHTSSNREDEVADLKVLQSKKQDFVFSTEDSVRSQRLWLWAKCFLEQYPLIKPQHRFTIANLAVEGAIDGRVFDRDLTVMVSAIFPNPEETRNSHTPCGFLRVWDGTGDGPNDP